MLLFLTAISNVLNKTIGKVEKAIKLNGMGEWIRRSDVSMNQTVFTKKDSEKIVMAQHLRNIQFFFSDKSITS